MWLSGYKTNQRIAFCLGDGCGIGNLVQALPAIESLYRMGNTIDVYISGFMYGEVAGVVEGQSYVRTIYKNTYENTEDIYDVCIVSFLSDHGVKNARKYLKMKKNWNKRSEYEQYCQTARKLGAKDFNPATLNISERDFNLKPLNILIHAGCTQRTYWERRKWTHYKELIDLLSKEGFHVYCCGKEDEVIDHPQVTAYNFLPIQETIALIKQCDLFLSNDSGLMHIAGALRKNQIAIFTATSDKKSGPYYNPHARVITPRIKCYPCYGKEDVWDKCNDWRCLDAITVAQVHNVIKEMVGQRQQ